MFLTSLPGSRLADVAVIARAFNMSHGRVIGVVGGLNRRNCMGAIQKGGKKVYLNESTRRVIVNSIVQSVRPLRIIGYTPSFYRVASTYQLGDTLTGTGRTFLSRLSGCAVRSVLASGDRLLVLLRQI